MRTGKTGVYKFEKKLFRYDFDEAMVEYLHKISAKDRKEDEKLFAEEGFRIWEDDGTGYAVIDSVGLRRENWTDKEARDGYLSEWIYEMEEELAYEMKFFEKEFGI